MGLTGSSCSDGVRTDTYDDDGGYSIVLYNADDCGVYLTDIRILQPFDITDDSGSSDGECGFKVWSIIPYDDLEWSIDDWSSSDTFASNYTATISSLAAGTYTLKVRHDTETTWESETTFEIRTIPEYGTRWRLKYDDLLGIETQIDIQKKDYSGSVTDICGTDQPFEYEWAEAEDKFAVIKTMRMRLRLISETDGQFSDLLDADEDEYRIKINKGGQLKFYLWILTEHVTIPHKDAPYSIEVVATDRIAKLKDIPFESRTGAKFNKLETDFKIIRRILRDAVQADGVDLNFEVYLPMKQTDMGTIFVPSISLAYHDCSDFVDDDGTPWTMYKVLEEVLRPYGVRLAYSPAFNLSWSIVQVKDISGTVSVYRYTGSTGNWSTINKSLESTLSLTPGQSNVNFVNDNQIESYQAGVKEVVSKFNINTVESLLIYGDFGLESSWQMVGFFPRLAYGWGPEDGTGAAYSRSRYIDYSDPLKPTGAYILTFDGTETTIGAAEYIKSIPVPVKIVDEYDARIAVRVNVRFSYFSSSPYLDYVYFNFAVMCGGNSMLNNGAWASGVHIIEYPEADPAAILQGNGIFDKEIILVSDVIPYSSSIREQEFSMRIYQPVVPGSHSYTYDVISVSAHIIQEEANLPEDVSYTYTNPGAYKAILKPIECLLGYYEDGQSVSTVIKRQFRDSDGIAITDWEQSGETGTYDIVDILAARIYEERRIKRRVIRGSIRGLFYVHGQLVYDGKNWLIDGLKRDDKTGIAEIVMLEMSSTMGWPT